MLSCSKKISSWASGAKYKNYVHNSYLSCVGQCVCVWGDNIGSLLLLSPVETEITDKLD